jgi:hypothetical protein
MIDFQVNLKSTGTSSEERITSRKGRLHMDLPVSFFQMAFVNFNEAAHTFAISLSDALDRKFAYQYFGYLQDIARGSKQLKRPQTNGRPNWRLVAVELERLFRCNFFRPEHLPSIPN